MRLPGGIRPLLHLPEHILPKPLLREVSQKRLLLRVLELLGHLQASASRATCMSVAARSSQPAAMLAFRFQSRLLSCRTWVARGPP